MFQCNPDLSLDINFTQFVGYHCTVNVRPWHEGISWSSFSDGQFTEYNFAEELPVPFGIICNERNAKDWLKTIPAEIRTALLPFEQKYKNISYSALWVISRDRYAYDFFLNQPLLFWLLLSHAKKKCWDKTKIFQLSPQRRIKILVECGLPANRPTLNFLSKLSFRSYGSHQYKLLVSILNNPESVKLNHRQSINEGLIDFISNFSWLLTSRLVTNNNEDLNWNSLKNTINDTVRIAGILGIEDIIRRIGNCRNFIEVHKLHDRLTDRLNVLEVNNMPDIAYPDPPIRGTRIVIPIKCIKELALEGRSQKHCVLSYHDRIMEGEYYVYKVLYPERATIGIRNQSKNSWGIDQIKLKCNKRPSFKTIETMNNWLLS